MEENFAHGKSEADRKSQILNMVKAVSHTNVEVLDGGASGSRHSQPKYEINVH